MKCGGTARQSTNASCAWVTPRVDDCKSSVCKKAPPLRFNAAVISFLSFLILLEFSFGAALAQIPNGTLFRRVSRASNFEFAIHNNGMLYGDWSYENLLSRRETWLFAQRLAHWPRGSFHMDMTWGTGKGLVVLAKKAGRLLSSEVAFMREAHSSHGPFDQMVPGRIGDPKAGYDPVFNGPGWRYIDDPDYIVYSSLDYDSTGVDTSGANFNDWPIRLVSGMTRYVADPLQRYLYKPVFLSDEDMFCVFKDTDTRADPIYKGPNGPSVPIGVEIHNYVYTWGAGPAKDIVLFQYHLINKSGAVLDSCYLIFDPNLSISGARADITVENVLSQKKFVYTEQSWRNLAYISARDQRDWYRWTATPLPPTIGYPLLETPRGYGGVQLGLSLSTLKDSVQRWVDSTGTGGWLYTCPSDSFVYRRLLQPTWDPRGRLILDTTLWLGPVLGTGPFPMAPGDTARLTVGFIFAENLNHLLLLDDFIRRVLNSNFQRPVPPSAPHLSVKGLNRAVKLSWDNSAESSTDPIIPDSLGEPFRGYRLLRAQAEQGPYVEIGRWVKDTLLVHEYLDRGEDIGGLKNNVRYYYRLLSFDAGAKLLKLDPMESKAVEGLNSQSVVPTTEPSNGTSSASGGLLSSGTLGDVTVPRLIPTSTTNFNNLLSGRTLSVTIDAATDLVRYTLPVTIRDSVAGRVHNAVVDPNLLVHGTPQTAGIKAGTATMKDIFGIGAANIELNYRFEQLSEPFHITPTIETQTGADVPIIVSDSLNAAGITITPYTTGAREITVEFTQGGLDTVNILFKRIVPYLTVQVTDVATGSVLQSGVDYTFAGRGAKTTGGQMYSTKANRYYLSGVLSNSESWDYGHMLAMYESKIAFDYTDHGAGSGKPTPTFTWASQHRSGTHDFQAGDRVRIKWQGGVKAQFPRNAVVRLQGAPPGRVEVTDEMLERIRIVPNPYMIRHEAQRGQSRLYFNYLPEECMIRIYTVALDLVKTINHRGGSREEWDLTTEGGQLVASQMLIASIEAPNGKATTKKFAVVVGR